MTEPLKLKMTIDEALEFADEWSCGLTLYEGAQGWRVVCLLLANEVRRLNLELDAMRIERNAYQDQCIALKREARE